MTITSPPSMHSPKEPARYWMWTRRNLLDRPLLSSIFLPPSTTPAYESWEEQAFARDSAGDLGGGVWPQRSYTCSFCQREFRSAQALGGHMNVHRRERARLKQASSLTRETTEEDAHHLNPSCSSIICSPNHNFVDVGFPIASSFLSKEEICSQRIKISPSFAAESVNLALGRGDSKAKESGCQRMRDFCDDDEEISCNKMLKSDHMFTLCISNTGGNIQLLKTEGINLRTEPVEELDLELRLGESPEVQQSLQQHCD